MHVVDSNCSQFSVGSSASPLIFYTNVRAVNVAIVGGWRTGGMYRSTKRVSGSRTIGSLLKFGLVTDDLDRW